MRRMMGREMRVWGNIRMYMGVLFERGYKVRLRSMREFFEVENKRLLGSIRQLLGKGIRSKEKN